MEDDEDQFLNGEEARGCDCAIQPYSTMPSLLELQQLNNRLNMAQASKKLLKWNSDCTGDELKKISAELQAIHANSGRDTRQAFILLARCRYFNQDFYRNVIEGVKWASLKVQTSCNTVAGVKMLSITPLEVSNPKICKCPFLCRGGQAIQEAKEVWSKLLRSLIKMAELRANFQAIEAANRDSTKRLNIINKRVLPKTQATINYIIDQLEETNREESHRIRVKTTKLRNNTRFISYTPDFTKEIKDKKYEVNYKDSIESVTSVYDTMPPVLKLIEAQSEAIKIQKTQARSKDVFQVVDIYEPMTEQISKHRINSINDLYDVSTVTEPVLMDILEQRRSLGDYDPKMNLTKIDKATEAVEGLLKVCKDTRNCLFSFLSNEKPCGVNPQLLVSLKQLKTHIDAVIQANSKLQSFACKSKSVKNIIKTFEKIDKNIKYVIKDVDSIALDKCGKARIQKLIKSIHGVVKTITDNKSEGLLTPSLEDLFKAYIEAKTKIEFDDIRHDLLKIDYLEGNIYNLESINTNVTSIDVKKTKLQNFLSSCKGFRKKLEVNKKPKRESFFEHKVYQSATQKREIELQVSFTESIHQFLSSCEDVIKQFKRCKRQ